MRKLLLGVAVLAGIALPQNETPMGGPLQDYSSRAGIVPPRPRGFPGSGDPEDGLGPAFNGTSCAVCHNIPAVGGTGTMMEVRAGYRDEQGQFHALEGGTLHHLFSIPPHQCQVTVYEEANVSGQRISIPLFGAGLVEAIPDETLLALADPDDADGDGVRGRAARVEDEVTRRRASRALRVEVAARHAARLCG